MDTSKISLDPSMIAANDRWMALTTNLRRFSSQNAPMDDEYGNLDNAGETYVYDGMFQLEQGGEIVNPAIRYKTYGALNEGRDNVLFVCHALTGNASVHQWWQSFVDEFSQDYYVICANVLGGHYGSTGPMSMDPVTSEMYGMSFPDVTVRDTARIFLDMLQNEVGVTSIKGVVGGSFGGMQAIEMAILSNLESYGPEVRGLIPLSSNAYHSAWQIGISEVQRNCILTNFENNPDFCPTKNLHGLSLARQMAMITYRSRAGYQDKFARDVASNKNQWQVGSYLDYQGQKFLSRFNPTSYIKLTEQMDTHDIGRGRGGIDKVLNSLKVPTQIIGISSDVLYPPSEQQYLYDKMKGTNGDNVKIDIIESDAGHDGFLLEQTEVNALIDNHLKTYE